MSNVALSTAPSRVCTVPSALITTKAGWLGTEKCANTLPGSSLICGKVNPYLSIKRWNDVSSPVQATPTNSTLPAHFWRAASTEGASRLQMLQVGAQNQNATGRPATDAPSNWPPPTSGAVNCNTAGTLLAVAVASAFVAAAEPAVAVVAAVGAPPDVAGLELFGEAPQLVTPSASTAATPSARPSRTRPARGAPTRRFTAKAFIATGSQAPAVSARRRPHVSRKFRVGSGTFRNVGRRPPPEFRGCFAGRQPAEHDVRSTLCGCRRTHARTF